MREMTVTLFSGISLAGKTKTHRDHLYSFIINEKQNH